MEALSAASMRYVSQMIQYPSNHGLPCRLSDTELQIILVKIAHVAHIFEGYVE